MTWHFLRLFFVYSCGYSAEMVYAASADLDGSSASSDPLRKIRRKISLTRGPAKKICQASAIGKFIAAVCSQVLIKPAV